MFLNVLEKWGVTILQEQIENFLLGQYLFDLMKDFEVVLLKFLVEIFHLDMVIDLD